MSFEKGKSDKQPGGKKKGKSKKNQRLRVSVWPNIGLNTTLKARKILRSGKRIVNLIKIFTSENSAI